MLELIRVSVHLEFPRKMPWESWVARFLSEPGWPYALAITTWLSISFLWVDHDCRLLPYLVHRAGIRWEGDDLAVNDADLVDEVLQKLPVSEAPATKRSKPSAAAAAAVAAARRPKTRR